MTRDLGAATPRGWSEPGRTTLEITTGGWRTRRPVYVEARAPCRSACPAGEPIAEWIERAARGDWASAWRLIREENPFPAVSGRVCGHPCERACNRAVLDGAVAINALERAVGDWGLEHGTPPATAVTRAARIAVVGSGPAGLACAHHLARLGYRVTLVETQARPGGLLRHGIPEYRLPRAVLDRELELALGRSVEIVTGCRLGVDVPWKTLECYDAVFLGTGAPVALRLGVPGEGLRGIGQGTEFLRRVNTDGPPAVGARVVVIGGGSTAMDVARSALRLGAVTVTVLALEERAAMPALPEEVEQALAEGVSIQNGVGVPAFLDAAGTVAGLVVAEARLQRAADGAVRPLFSGARRALPADEVLLAIGQCPDLVALPAGIAAAGGLVAVDEGGATTASRVFAGGDLVSHRRTVADAIGAGTRAARAIHARLTGERRPAFAAPRPWAEPRPGNVVSPAALALAGVPRAHRAARRERLPGARARDLGEVVQGLSEAAALAEAARCLSCGRCAECDICLAVCPDMAIRREGGGYRVALGYCKGCGLCAAECPRGALAMEREP